MKIKVEEEADKEFVTPPPTSRRADKISEGAGSSAALAKAKPKAKRKAAAPAPFDPAVEFKTIRTCMFLWARSRCV